MPKVSVIIPTYNRAHIVGEAIASVLAQTCRDFEAIVVDDGSTDETRAVIDRYVEQYGDQVKYLYQENAGSAAARNIGIRAARGDLIAFLDSDDLWLPHHLALTIKALDGKPEYQFSFGQRIVMQLQNGNWKELGIEPLWEDESRAPQGRALFLATWLGGMPLQLSSFVIRKDLAERVGPFDVDLRVCQDMDWIHRITWSAQGIYIPQVLAYRRGHADGNSRNLLKLTACSARIHEKWWSRRAELTPEEKRAIRFCMVARDYVRGWGFVKAGRTGNARRLLLSGLLCRGLRLQALCRLLFSLLPAGLRTRLFERHVRVRG